LNYQDWLKVIKIIELKEHKSEKGKTSIASIRDDMNSKRIYFNWDHLNQFYNLYK
jgi:hypothetical protein